MSTFTQFGTEQDLVPFDVGQPKFYVDDPSQPTHFIYVLMGSLHMPLEDPESIASVETYVNSGSIRTALIAALSRYFQYPFTQHTAFKYIPRAQSPKPKVQPYFKAATA